MIGQSMNGMDERQAEINRRMAGPPEPDSPAALRAEIDWYKSALVSLFVLAGAKNSPLTNANVASICKQVLDKYHDQKPMKPADVLRVFSPLPENEAEALRSVMDSPDQQPATTETK